MNQPILPARNPRVVARDLGDEIVVLDPVSQQAHRLLGHDAQAWRLAGSAATDEQLHAHAARLQVLGILEREGISRRTVLARAGLVAAAAPLASLALPMARAAASVSSVTSFTVTSCANHTITQATVGTTGTKNQTYMITINSPALSGVTGTLSGTGKTDGNSGHDNVVVTGSMTAPAGTYTLNYVITDTTDNTTSTGQVQVTFC